MSEGLPKIGAPATQALHAQGIDSLRQVALHTEAELSELHGVGPKAIRILRDELERHGLRFSTA